MLKRKFSNERQAGGHRAIHAMLDEIFVSLLMQTMSWEQLPTSKIRKIMCLRSIRAINCTITEILQEEKRNRTSKLSKMGHTGMFISHNKSSQCFASELALRDVQGQAKIGSRFTVVTM